MGGIVVPIACVVCFAVLLGVVARRRLVTARVVRRAAILGGVALTIVVWVWGWHGGVDGARLAGRATLIGAAVLGVALSGGALWRRRWGWGRTGMACAIGLAAYVGFVLPRAAVGGPLAAVPTVVLVALAPWLPDSCVFGNRLGGLSGWELLGEHRRGAMSSWESSWLDRRFEAGVPKLASAAALERADRVLIRCPRLHRYEKAVAAMALRGLVHADAAVRRRAAQVIGAYYTNGKSCVRGSESYLLNQPEVVEVMIAAMEDSDERVSAEAIDVLGLCGASTPVVEERLKWHGFHSESWSVAYSAREAMDRIGIDYSGEFDAFRRDVGSGDREVCIDALVRMGRLVLLADLEGERRVLEIVRGPDSELAVIAAGTFCSWPRRTDEEAIDNLRRAVRSREQPDNKARACLLNAYCGLEDLSAETIASAKADPSPWVRQAAEELAERQRRYGTLVKP